MLAIKNNIMSMNAARQLGSSYDNLTQSVERLSSGLRINSAKDDAAGLAVRELIRADVAALNQGARNARDAISMLQAAEGALGAVDEILVRMRELAEQAATDTYSSEQKTIMQEEFAELAQEITRIADNTEFNGHNLLQADASDAKTISLGNGLTAGQTIQVNTHDISADAIGTAATGATATAKMWTTDANSDFITNSEAAVNVLEFNFGGGVTADISFASSTSKSLNDIVSELNTDHGHEVTASAVYSSGTGQWTLKVVNDTTGATGAPTVTEDGGALTNFDWAGVTGTPDVASTDFTLADGAGTGTNIDAADISTASGADTAIAAIDAAIVEKDTFRAHLGYMMNRLESAASVIDIQAENLQAAESRVSDVDVATEMAQFTRNQVLAQAGISMLGQANQMPQMALKLLG